MYFIIYSYFKWLLAHSTSTEQSPGEVRDAGAVLQVFAFASNESYS